MDTYFGRPSLGHPSIGHPSQCTMNTDPPTLVANKYRVVGHLGNGRFGTVYLGVHVRTGEKVAIKTEPNAGGPDEIHLLKHESAILNYLYSASCRNIPPVYWYGGVPDLRMTALVQPYYERDLKTYIDAFPLNLERYISGQASSSSRDSQIYRFMRSAILVLRNVHAHGIIHRDIKPDNLMIRTLADGTPELVLIDFGLATFVDENTGGSANCKPDGQTHIIGTPKFASWYVHRGYAYLPRDDLMSLAYIGMWLIFGENFWGGVSLSDTDLEFGMDICDNDVPAIHINSSMNLWFRLAKSPKYVRSLFSQPIRDSSSPLLSFIDAVYSLSGSDPPDYDSLVKIFANI